jgi:hypothetical protein
MLKQRSITSCCFLVVLTLTLILSAGLVEATNYIRYVDAGLTDKYYGSEKPDCSTYSSNSGKCSGGSAAAYSSIEDVNVFIQKLENNDSASIYFKRGSKWSITRTANFLNIRKKNIFVGAFGSGSLPIFDGKGTAFQSQNVNSHAPLILVSGNNCTVDSIRLINSYGSGVRIENVSSGIIKNCQINKAGWAGVAIAGTSSGIAVERNEITEAGYRGDQGPEPKFSSHPQAIQANTFSVQDISIRYNHVYNCYTEGIGASGNLVEFNLVGPTLGSGIYAGEKPGIIRYNMVYGTSNAKFFSDSKNGRLWCSSGIAIDEEKYHIDSGFGAEIYGNIIIGRYAGLRVRNETKTIGKEAHVYNNTFIDNAYNIMVSAPEYWDIAFKNNLSIVYDTKYSRHVACYGDSSRLNIGPNHWSSEPEDKRWYNSSRDEVSDPRLSKTNGWTSLTGISSFSFSNLIPSINSTAYNNSKAIKLGNTNGYQPKFLTTGTNFVKLPNNPTFKLISQNDSGKYWDFGAIVVNGSSSQNPSSPSSPPAPSLWIVK